MSEAHSPTTSADSAAPLFDNAEIREFQADDVAAGRAIGKMLSILFIYTVIAMSIVAAWTYNANLTAANASSSASQTH